MGTEVIRSCIEQLIIRKMDHILYKVVTFGGVADKENVERCLRKAVYPICWTNFQCQKDYAVKYVFKTCTLGSKPIGSGGVKRMEGHDIENI
jgi:hypothetical protein